ncbi:FtsW/RodA/SpoVE family cell cycle protein [Gracilibacillus caseinilyticus]|uniref:FtsW/RodA/SpoVE family cell cycle protein n=1 Tax=Gracilibacillus caseinilyticus TaxID=2932256 RepID=A0ABY4F2H1_9BACI|nr:FtsW/RodA/SpoVE family cell cycle protein [Gracilibacillus caseinilyticus]UOQ48626.1 FtsW/RodA/SpoVE family cell cycle protein [Gracilibacillus caseinilyticus]
MRKMYVRYDLLYILLLFTGVSLFAIYNAQQLNQYEGENFVFKQAVWILLGIIAIACLQLLETQTIYLLSTVSYYFGLSLLVVLLISPETIVPTLNGANSWFQFNGITFQPSELTKITTILYLSYAISKHKEKFHTSSLKYDLLLFIKILLIGLAPVVLILLQPDFGTAMVLAGITIIMLFLSGINWKIIFGIATVTITVASIFIFMAINLPDVMQNTFKIDNYQINRIETWIGLGDNDSGNSYQIDKALVAIGSGYLHGYQGETSSIYIPEAHTDFIFSIIGHNFGFIGAAIVIFLYFFLIYTLIQIGLKLYNINLFGSYICFGYITLILIHTIQNIGMNVGIMPITGIPLLLISYGGSSTLTSLIGYGLIYKAGCELLKEEDYMFKESEVH